MSTLHESTFEYYKPTVKQALDMGEARAAAAKYAEVIDTLVPLGPDKTFILRELRGLAMWVNVAITRHADGTPRGE